MWFRWKDNARRVHTPSLRVANCDNRYAREVEIAMVRTRDHDSGSGSHMRQKRPTGGHDVPDRRGLQRAGIETTMHRKLKQVGCCDIGDG